MPAATLPGSAATVLAFPQTSQARLRLALQGLDRALAEQREAIALFRQELAALRGAVQGLERSTRDYQLALTDAAARTDQARLKAAELMATARAMEGRL